MMSGSEVTLEVTVPPSDFNVDLILTSSPSPSTSSGALPPYLTMEAANGSQSGNCSEHLSHFTWTNHKLTSIIILVVINALVLAGNTLVILAVFLSSKLRTVTNLFIVSLAVSDLLLGVSVLPFSMAYTVFESWVFMAAWCTMWQAIDVWLSTASILNLVVISLDRYVAVTRPVSYPSRMTHVRAKVLIALVWVISFLICLPPLVGWTGSERAQTVVVEADCTRSCSLNDDPWYVVYSACGSFFLPTLVMLFFYWKIYCAAAETTRAINQGFRTTKNKRILGSRFQEERLTLRIHRGRNSVQERHHRGGSDRRYNNGHPTGGGGEGGVERGGNIKMKTLRPQLIMKPSMGVQPDVTHTGERCNLCHAQCTTHVRTNDPGACYALNTNSSQGDNAPAGEQQQQLQQQQEQQQQQKQEQENQENEQKQENEEQKRQRRRHQLHKRQQQKQKQSSPASNNTLAPPNELQVPQRFPGQEGATTPSAPPKTGRGRPTGTSRMGRRNIKLQVKRFRMETKAAKTLGVIVGVFTLCWLPFFTMYLLRGVCAACAINDLLFEVLFWLGYCNSAINPFIYALFSKDFRFAFKSILCRCVCRRENRTQRPTHHASIYIPSFDRDNDSDDDFPKH